MLASVPGERQVRGRGPGRHHAHIPWSAPNQFHHGAEIVGCPARSEPERIGRKGQRYTNAPRQWTRKVTPVRKQASA